MGSVWGTVMRLLTAALMASAAAGPAYVIPFLVTKTSQVSSANGKPQSRSDIQKHELASEPLRGEETIDQNLLMKVFSISKNVAIIFSGFILVLLAAAVLSFVVGIVIWFLPILIIGTILTFVGNFSKFCRHRFIWLVVGSAAGLILMRAYPSLVGKFLFLHGVYAMMLEYALAGSAAALARLIHDETAIGLADVE